MASEDLAQQTTQETQQVQILLPRGLNNEVYAMKEMILQFPWMVVNSKAYEGRCFFFNPQTKKSLWSLNESEALGIILGVHQVDEDAKLTNLRLSSTNENMAAENAITPTVGRMEAEQLDFPSILPSSSSSSQNSNNESPMSGSLLCKKSTSSPARRGSAQFRRRSIRTPSPQVSRVNKAHPITSDEASTPSASSMESLGSISSSKAAVMTPKYHVLDGIGSGGFAVVVKVSDCSNNKIYAMKVIQKSKQSAQQTLSEHSILSKISTSIPFPFLQCCYSAFENHELVYFILDYYGGGDLYYHFKRRKTKNGGRGFEELEAQFIVAELCLAIEHLHEHHIIHRDIKIENVMLDVQGHVKLVDFGLAVDFYTIDERQLKKLGRKGSLMYLAPELIQDGVLGVFTDWWALGVLTFELLTGSTPWSNLSSKKAIVNDIMNMPVQLPHGKYAPSTERFVHALFRHDYKNRLQNSDFRNYSFFESYDWEKLLNLEIKPVFIPGNVSIPRRDKALVLSAYYEIAGVHEQTGDLNGYGSDISSQTSDSMNSFNSFSHKLFHFSDFSTVGGGGGGGGSEDSEARRSKWTIGLEPANNYLP